MSERDEGCNGFTKRFSVRSHVVLLFLYDLVFFAALYDVTIVFSSPLLFRLWMRARFGILRGGNYGLWTAGGCWKMEMELLGWIAAFEVRSSTCTGGLL